MVFSGLNITKYHTSGWKAGSFVRDETFLVQPSTDESHKNRVGRFATVPLAAVGHFSVGSTQKPRQAMALYVLREQPSHSLDI